jgi:chromosome segregation ATPase
MLREWFTVQVRLPTRLRKQFGSVESDLQSIKESVSNLVGAVNLLIMEMSMANQAMDDMKQAVDAMAQGIADEHDQVESAKVLISGLMDKVSQITTQLEQASVDNAEVSAATTRLRSLVDTVCADKDGLAEKVVAGTPGEK